MFHRSPVDRLATPRVQPWLLSRYCTPDERGAARPRWGPALVLMGATLLLWGPLGFEYDSTMFKNFASQPREEIEGDRFRMVGFLFRTRIIRYAGTRLPEDPARAQRALARNRELLQNARITAEISAPPSATATAWNAYVLLDGKLLNMMLVEEKVLDYDETTDPGGRLGAALAAQTTTATPAASRTGVTSTAVASSGSSVTTEAASSEATPLTSSSTVSTDSSASGPLASVTIFWIAVLSLLQWPGGWRVVRDLSSRERDERMQQALDAVQITRRACLFQSFMAFLAYFTGSQIPEIFAWIAGFFIFLAWFNTGHARAVLEGR